jgi:hypothetical protein
LIVNASLIFEKRFTVLKTVNRFSKLYSSSLHARLISDCPNPAVVGRSKPGGTGIRHHSAIGILPASESDDIRPPPPDAGGPTSGGIRSDLTKMAGMQPLIRPDLAKMAGIRPDLTKSRGVLLESGQTCSPESGDGDLTLPDSSNSCIFSFRNFFMRTKHRKIFSRKLFFFEIDFVENILLWKPFYVEINRALIK